MKYRGIDILTLLIITIVTILIWMLAENKTREEATLDANVQFDAPGQGNFLVTPKQLAVELQVEGPSEAVRRVRRLLLDSLTLPVRAKGGPQPINDLAGSLRQLDELRETGVSIVSVTPAATELLVEELVTRSASVQAVLPSASTVENVQVSQDVEVTLPANEVDRLPQPLTVEAVVSQWEVERLEPGLHTLEGLVQLPGNLSNLESVTITPPRVEVTFRLVSRVKSMMLEQVRIQINSAPQDFGQYRVTLPDQFLHDVNVEADADIVSRLEKGEGQVVAVVYLSTNDKEKRLEKKPVAYFTALLDGIGYTVTATVDGEAHPEVELEIRPLVDPVE